MDQWCSKFSESFSLDRHWSIECSSLLLFLENRHLRPKAGAQAAKPAPTVELKIDYALGFIICDIFTVITLQDWVGCRKEPEGKNAKGKNF